MNIKEQASSKRNYFEGERAFHMLLFSLPSCSMCVSLTPACVLCVGERRGGGGGGQGETSLCLQCFIFVFIFLDLQYDVADCVHSLCFFCITLY